MARPRRRAAGPAGSGGPGQQQGLRRQQQQQEELRGKQRPAPRPGPRSQEKKKVNCKPKNQDEQEIPFRLREIMRSRQQMRNPISNKKRRKEARVAFRKTLEKEARGMEPDIAVPKFRRKKWESDRAYIQHMEQETQHVLFLSKNQAVRQPEAQDAPKRDKKEKSECRKVFQKRRLDKVRQRKEDKAADRLERELLQDTVKFGEVALQPPELTARPRKSVGREQPGKKSLMLRMLLGPGSASQPLSPSLARQRFVEEERERVVQAYRTLKKLKQQQQGPQSSCLPPGKKPGVHL
ncbi:coiled-coil domain-containing protein 137 [Elephas maximus indicus]|uniref:coiled-coil domain-containing protein 137 n=1 Tax=Elephas maximus indicus TaxID=99487 RepID=UPI00211718D2|nr:coiled-coil domain-containing protein 137 [Elephas maximus indicus]